MKKRSPSTNKVQLPRWVSIAVVAVVAIVAAVTVVFAYLHLQSSVPGAGTVPPGSVQEPEPAPTQTPEPSEEPEPEEPEWVVPTVQRLLAVNEAQGHMLRAHIGSCTEPGMIETSFDGGVTWQQGSTAAIDATKILQLDTTSVPGMDRLVALDGDCDVVYARSFIGGVDWAENDTAVAWYVDPADSSVVVSPVGRQPLGCEIAGLAASSERAIALCTNSTILVAYDSGGTWSAPVDVPNGVAVGVGAAEFMVASSAEPDCAGVRVRLFDGSALGGQGACIENADQAAGEIALTIGAEISHVWVGSQLYGSRDLGQNWEQIS